MQTKSILNTTDFETRTKQADTTITQEAPTHKEKCVDCGKNLAFRNGLCIGCLEYRYGPRVKPIKRVFKKVGRNDVCPCGSGMKFKNCCKTEINLLKKAESLKNEFNT
jgi:uncharacterized protein YecA (UPF0149 family)